MGYSMVLESYHAFFRHGICLKLFYGFIGLCEDFLSRHPEYFIVPVRISGSAIESVFSCLKYISGSNLSAINYSTSLSAPGHST